MASKRGAMMLLNKKKNRKEFRKQQRKLKKKSKKLAKQFGKLQRENRLKIKVEKKKKIKPILQRSTNKKKKEKPRKSVRFADAQQLKKQTIETKDEKEIKEDVWIDEREERWIKTLERRMGYRRSEEDKYWKQQEFTQDGLDCFFDLGYLSGDSDIDEHQEEYQKYCEFKDFLSTQSVNDDKPNAQLHAYKKSQLSQQQKNEKRKQKEAIYGEGVYHSDDEDANNDANIDDNDDTDVSMKAFLEESDNESESVAIDTINNDNTNKTEATTNITNKLNKTINKYIPPQLRRLQSQQSDTNIQLRRSIGGHLNRLLFHNLKAIASAIGVFYADNEYTGKQITEILCECIYNLMDKQEDNNALNSLILCLSALFASIYAKNGNMNGSNMIEIFSKYIASNLNNAGIMRNLLRFMSYLYLFGMLSAKYLIEVLIEFIQTCDIDSFHILSVPMLICGPILRSCDPIKFKDLILLICNRSKEFKSDKTQSAKHEIHIEDTMKIVFDIKDNIRTSAVNDTMNGRQFQELRSSIGTITKIAISYKDFINIPKHGRWWLSGAAVRGGVIATKMNPMHALRPNPVWKSKESACSFSEQLLKMSQKFHMNSPIRRAIFCIVMDSDDYIDAFQKLMSLNIIHGEHTEILRIVLLLCLRQNTYNKYYALLLSKIISHRKGWKFGLHCALWDKFSELEEMNTNDIINLAKLVADLLNEHCINVVVLKKLDIIKTEPKNLLFVSTLFNGMLTKNNIFGSLSRNANVRELRQDMQLFFTSVMIPRTQKQIAQWKKKHAIAQKMYQKNTLSKDELIKIGLKLRKEEDQLILIKSALNSTYDHQVKTSTYNDLLF